ncbi:unnamed protein product, partial [Medioppia subpectinata]
MPIIMMVLVLAMNTESFDLSEIASQTVARVCDMTTINSDIIMKLKACDKQYDDQWYMDMAQQKSIEPEFKKCAEMVRNDWMSLNVTTDEDREDVMNACNTGYHMCYKNAYALTKQQVYLDRRTKNACYKSALALCITNSMQFMLNKLDDTMKLKACDTTFITDDKWQQLERCTDDYYNQVRPYWKEVMEQSISTCRQTYNDQLTRIWNLEREKQLPKFWWALMRTYGIEFTILLTIIVLVECVIRISAPLLLGFVIDYFAGQTYLTFADACMAAAGMVFGTILSVVIISPCQIRIGQLAMRVRVASTTLMYHKFGISMGFLLAAPIQTIMVISITWAYLVRLVFVIMALFNILRLSVNQIFTHAINFGAESWVTCRRIEARGRADFDQNFTLGRKTELPAGIALPTNIMVKNIFVKWNKDNYKLTLDNISVDLNSGDLLAVIGPVGSGKSSFLMSLLGELELMSGSIHINGTVSYSAQESWSFNNSVRNNILFGREYDERRYREVVRVCALERDLKILPFGDRTLMGENGVSVSGGQKARITLARSLYRNADICLMDDPLSAVDAAVAEHIFEQCIVDYLGPKIRILVTHQIQFIRNATKILVLDDGKCLALGTFDELLAKGLDFMALIDGTDDDNNNGGDNEGEGVVGVVGGGEGVMGMFEGQMTAGNAPDVVSPRFGSISRASLSVPTGTTGSVRRGSSARRRASSIQPRKSMVESEAPHIEEELQTQGSIGGRVYWLYVKAGCGLFMGTVTLVFTFLSQALFHASDIWLLVWASLSETGQSTFEKNQLYVIIYAVLIAALLLATIVRVLTWYHICLKAAKTLHNRVFTTLFRAPMAVFDSNPIGRIMNRFSKDVSAIDEVLPNVLYEVNLGVSLIVFTIIVAALVNYYLVIPGVIVLILSAFIRNIYIKTARDIKRMEGLTRSPVLSHVSATLRGLASIRAYGAQQAFQNQFYKYQDDHSATWFIYLAAARTLGITIDWLFGSSIGLAFVSVLMLINYTQYGVRQSAEMESHMTSVERIIEYTKLPQEADLLSTQHNTPDPQWPQT